MSLRKGLDELKARNEHTVCGVQRFKEVNPEFGAELEELLEESRLPGGPSLRALARRLAQPDVGAEWLRMPVLRRHRARECKCEELGHV